MKEFNHFLISVAIVLAGCVIVDMAVGKAGDRLLAGLPHAKTFIAHSNYCLRQVDADIVIIGASRANHHYATSMIADSLNLSVYNAGQDGRKFGYNSSILNGILQHSRPKIVIFDAAEELIGGAYNDRACLHPYYYSDTYIASVINDVDKYAVIKLSSNMYRYNDKLHNLVYGYIASADESDRGYKPLAPKQNKSLQKSITNDVPTVNKTAHQFFMNIVNWSKQYGYKLIVVDSPRLVINENNYSIIRPICEQNNIVCIDNSNLPYFMEHPELFNDASHLNKTGAEIYTQMFIEQIKPLIANSCRDGSRAGEK